MSPDIYIDYILCREFGWTPNQVNEIDINTIYWFLYIMNLEARIQEREIKRAQRK